jgi:hypothetical protein
MASISLVVAWFKALLWFLGGRAKIPACIKRTKMNGISWFNREYGRELTGKASMQRCSFWLDVVDGHAVPPRCFCRVSML